MRAGILPRGMMAVFIILALVTAIVLLTRNRSSKQQQPKATD